MEVLLRGKGGWVARRNPYCKWYAPRTPQGGVGRAFHALPTTLVVCCTSWLEVVNTPKTMILVFLQNVTFWLFSKTSKRVKIHIFGRNENGQYLTCPKTPNYIHVERGVDAHRWDPLSWVMDAWTCQGCNPLTTYWIGLTNRSKPRSGTSPKRVQKRPFSLREPLRARATVYNRDSHIQGGSRIDPSTGSMTSGVENRPHQLDP